MIVRCDGIDKANKIFDVLLRTAGQSNPLGNRIFSESDVTEAWLRCTSYFEEKQAREAEESSSSSSDASGQQRSGCSDWKSRR